MRDSVLETAKPRGGAGSRKFAAGTARPRLEQPLVGKPGAGALAAESRSAAPPRASPFLSPGVGRCSKPARGHAGLFASFPCRFAPASPPAAGASSPPCHPRSEGARLQLRLPGSRSGRISPATTRRGRHENWRGTACLLLPRIDCHRGLQTSSGRIPRRPIGCAYQERRRSSARSLGWEPASSI